MLDNFQSSSKVCPKCGSGKVTLDKGRAACVECVWSGDSSDLIDVSLYGEAAAGKLSRDLALSCAEEISETYLTFLAMHAAKHIGFSMVQSGIVSLKDTENMTRLIRAACLGAHKATLEEITVIEKENKSSEQIA